MLSVFQRYPTALPEAQDAPPVSAPGLKPPGRNRRQSRPRFPPSSAVKLDLFPGITCSTLKKIFTEFIFTSRPPSSPGALPCRPPARSPSPPAPTRCLCPHNARLCQGNNVCSPSRMGGLEMKRSCPPPRLAPAPCCTLRQEKEEFLQECRGEGINIHVLGCVWLQLEGCLRGRRAGALGAWLCLPFLVLATFPHQKPGSCRSLGALQPWGTQGGSGGGQEATSASKCSAASQCSAMGKKGKLVLAVKQTCPKSLPAPADLHPRARWQPVSGCCSFPLQRWPPASCSKLFPMCKQGGW